MVYSDKMFVLNFNHYNLFCPGPELVSYYCRAYLKPLFRMIKKQTVPDDIRDSLVNIFDLAFLYYTRDLNTGYSNKEQNDLYLFR